MAQRAEKERENKKKQRAARHIVVGGGDMMGTTIPAKGQVNGERREARGGVGSPQFGAWVRHEGAASPDASVA